MTSEQFKGQGRIGTTGLQFGPLQSATMTAPDRQFGPVHCSPIALAPDRQFGP